MTSPGRRAHVKRAKTLRKVGRYLAFYCGDFILACSGAETRIALNSFYHGYSEKRRHLANAIRAAYRG